MPTLFSSSLIDWNFPCDIRKVIDFQLNIWDEEHSQWDVDGVKRRKLSIIAILASEGVVSFLEPYKSIWISFFRSAEHQRALWKLQEVSSSTESQGNEMSFGRTLKLLGLW